MDRSAKSRASGAGNMAEDNHNANSGNESVDLTRSALDELLKLESELRAAIDAKQDSKRQWRVHEQGLRYSNWKVEVENMKFRELTDRLDEKIHAQVEKSERDTEELEKYKTKNRQEASDFWNYFQMQTAKYSHLLPNAQIEYSSDCLTRDIEIYRQKAVYMREKIAGVEENMNSLITRYGLVELGTNKDAKTLEDFEAARKTLSDKREIVRATRLEAENIDVLQLTIKQKKQDIAYVKEKSCKLLKKILDPLHYCRNSFGPNNTE